MKNLCFVIFHPSPLTTLADNVRQMDRQATSVEMLVHSRLVAVYHKLTPTIDTHKTVIFRP